MEQLIKDLTETLNKLSEFIFKLPTFQKYDNLSQSTHTYSSVNTKDNVILIQEKTFHSLSIGLQYIDSESDVIPSFTMKIGKNGNIETHQHGNYIQLSSINVNEITITLLPNTKLVLLKQY